MIRALLLFMIRFISIFFRAMGLRACRFAPTCSEYAAQAYREYGLVKASWLTFKRVSSCHPFHAGGYQPLVKPPLN